MNEQDLKQLVRNHNIMIEIICALVERQSDYPTQMEIAEIIERRGRLHLLPENE